MNVRLLAALLLLGAAHAQTLTIYSGRGEALVQPIVERFTAETGIRVAVRYGGTSELAVLILEEGRASPADLFWGQDAGALGALAGAGRFVTLPQALTADLPAAFRSRNGAWIATSGRARVLAYSPERTASTPWPASVLDLTDAAYRGRVAWAPTNASFQAFVTAMRVALGEETTEGWLRGMIAAGTKSYQNNTSLIEAIAAGEVDYALTNHYYLLRFLATNPAYPVAQDFFAAGDVGNLINVAGAGVLGTSGRQAEAIRFLEFLLAQGAQEYFTQEVGEYPVRADVTPAAALVDLATLTSVGPDLDLDALEDLSGTLELLRRVGLL
jgi:iron(III) transport system substrate-binding protein